MQKMIYTFITLLTLQNICFAQTPCLKSTPYKEAIINNILNLTEEQIELKSLDCKAFKKHLTRNQKIKYNMIKKLKRNEYKKSHKQKNYYKYRDEDSRYHPIS